MIVLVVAACGGDDDGDPPVPVTADEQEYVDAIVRDFAAEDREAATCFAGEVIGAVGVDQLRSAGVTPEDLVEAGPLSDVGVTIGDEAAAELERSLTSCGDLVALTIGGSEASAKELSCARDHLTNEIAAKAVVAGLRGEDPNADAEQAIADFQACVDES